MRAADDPRAQLLTFTGYVMTIKKPTIRVVLGRRGSGKSSLLMRWADEFPRVLVLDDLHEYAPTGEDEADDYAYTLEDAIEQLRTGAQAEPPWIIYAGIDAEQYPALIAYLMPAQAGAKGYAQAVGGVCVVCGEADQLAPNHAGIDSRVKAMLHRGRHYGLSLLAATRRPTEMHRDVTGLADIVATFAMHEPRDVRWLEQSGGQSFAVVAQQLSAFEYATYATDTGRVSRYDGADRLQRVESQVSLFESPEGDRG